MNLLDEIRNSKKKPKELVADLVEVVKKDKKLLEQIPECLKIGNDVERGNCLWMLTDISKEQPEWLEPYIEMVVDYINDKAPRVKWEADETLANLAEKYPDKVGKAVDKLLINTKDKGTVVRWSAALALGEIAKYNLKLRPSLLKQIDNILKKEVNNGVKNVYLRALKEINKK